MFANSHNQQKDELLIDVFESVKKFMLVGNKTKNINFEKLATVC